MSKQFIFRCCVLLALMLGGAVSAAAAGAGGNAADYRVYENPAYNFAMAYPADWRVVEGYMGTVVLMGSPAETPTDKFAENISVYAGKLPPNTAVTLDQYTAANIEQLRKVVGEFKLIKQEKATLAGAPAGTIIYTGRQGVFRLKWRQDYLVVDNVAYVITFTAEEAQYDKYEKTVRTILKSFRLQSPAAVQ